MKSGFLSLLHLLALGLVDLLDKIIDECDDQHVGDVCGEPSFEDHVDAVKNQI